MSDAPTPLLECRNVSKAFGAVQALYRVDFEVRPGEVMALVGDNGAGKSTLIKGIAGIYPYDEGEIFVDGQRTSIHGPRDAAKLGIEIVYQDLALADNLDVVANMFLGRERIRSRVVLDESSMETLGPGDARRPLRDDAPLGAPGGRRALGRPAAVGRGREGRHVELPRGDPRRADRRARRRADAAGLEPRPAPRREGPRRRDHLAQPPRHLRVRRPHHGPAPRPEGRLCSRRPRRTRRRSSTRSPPASWTTYREWTPRRRSTYERPDRSDRRTGRPRPRRRDRRHGGRFADRRRLHAALVAGRPRRGARLAADHPRPRTDLSDLQPARGELPDAAQLHEPDPPDGGGGDDRDRRRLRPPDRRDRPLGRLRERRRRRRHDAASATGRSGLALVGRNRVRTRMHDADRLPPGARDHEVRGPLVRGHAGRVPDLVRRRADPDDAVLDRRDDPDPGRHGGRARDRLPERLLGLGPRNRRCRALRVLPASRSDRPSLERARGQADAARRHPDGSARGRLLHRDLVPEPRPRCPDSRADSRGPPRLLVVHRLEDPLRAARLRGRRLGRGRAPRRDQRRPRADHGLHDLEPHGRRRRDHARLAAALGRDQHGRREPPAASSSRPR